MLIKFCFRVILNLDEAINMGSVINAIDNLEYNVGGNTRTGRALREVESVFSSNAREEPFRKVNYPENKKKV